MKVSKFYNQDFGPKAVITASPFTLYVENQEVEIECDWDHGYGGSGTERTYLSVDDLLAILIEYKEKCNVR